VLRLESLYSRLWRLLRCRGLGHAWESGNREKLSTYDAIVHHDSFEIVVGGSVGVTAFYFLVTIGRVNGVTEKYIVVNIHLHWLWI
jgi:hypothetical protein